MKKTLQLSLFTLAAILLFTGIGLCGQCSWYRDFGTRWTAHIEGALYPLTSNDIIGQYLNDDDVEPLPPGAKLKTVIYEAIPEIRPQQAVNYLIYDVYGRVKKVKIYNPALQKVVVQEDYLYETTSSDSLIARVRYFDINSPVEKVAAISFYIYKDDPNAGRILQKVKTILPDRTLLNSDEVAPYDPNVFEDFYSMGDEVSSTEVTFIRDTQNHVIASQAHNLDLWPDVGVYEWFYKEEYTRNPDGKLVEMKACDANHFWVCQQTRSHTRYIRDASGLLKRIKNMKTGQIERRFIYSVE